MGYERHEDMVAPARGRPELWRLGAGLAGSFAIFWVAMALVVTTILLAIGPTEGQILLETSQEDARPFGTYLILLLAGLIAAGPLMVARPIHGRSAWTLFGPLNRAVLDFALALRGLVLLYAVLMLMPGGGEWPDKALGFGRWMSLLPLSLMAILIQTTAEEVAFRGYLQSELAARFKSPLVWMLAPALVFGLAHYAPGTYEENAVLVALSAFAFALAAADITARTGTLGGAIAMHFAGNFVAIALFALQGPYSGIALYTYPYTAAALTGPDFLLDLGIVGCSWLAVRVALRV